MHLLTLTPYYAHLDKIRQLAAEIERNSSGKSWEEDYENACASYKFELSNFSLKISDYLGNWTITKNFLKMLSVKTIFLEEFKSQFVEQIKDGIFAQFIKIHPTKEDVRLLMQHLPYKGLIINSIQHSYSNLLDDFLNETDCLIIKSHLNDYRETCDYLVKHCEMVDPMFFENFDRALFEFNRMVDKVFFHTIKSVLQDSNDIEQSIKLFPQYQKVILNFLFENCKHFLKTNQDALLVSKYILDNPSYKSSLVKWFLNKQKNSSVHSELDVEAIESSICTQLQSLNMADESQCGSTTIDENLHRVFSKKRKFESDTMSERIDSTKQIIR